eukprot:Lankesteria_metandrocarpae@DN3408_c0_g2_i1.p1
MLESNLVFPLAVSYYIHRRDDSTTILPPPRQHVQLRSDQAPYGLLPHCTAEFKRMSKHPANGKLRTATCTPSCAAACAVLQRDQWLTDRLSIKSSYDGCPGCTADNFVPYTTTNTAYHSQYGCNNDTQQQPPSQPFTGAGNTVQSILPYFHPTGNLWSTAPPAGAMVPVRGCCSYPATTASAPVPLSDSSSRYTYSAAGIPMGAQRYHTTTTATSHCDDLLRRQRGEYNSQVGQHHVPPNYEYSYITAVERSRFCGTEFSDHYYSNLDNNSALQRQLLQPHPPRHHSMQMLPAATASTPAATVPAECARQQYNDSNNTIYAVGPTCYSDTAATSGAVAQGIHIFSDNAYNKNGIDAGSCVRSCSLDAVSATAESTALNHYTYPTITPTTTSAHSSTTVHGTYGPVGRTTTASDFALACQQPPQSSHINQPQQHVYEKCPQLVYDHVVSLPPVQISVYPYRSSSSPSVAATERLYYSTAMVPFVAAAAGVCGHHCMYVDSVCTCTTTSTTTASSRRSSSSNVSCMFNATTADNGGEFIEIGNGESVVPKRTGTSDTGTSNTTATVLSAVTNASSTVGDGIDPTTKSDLLSDYLSIGSSRGLQEYSTVPSHSSSSATTDDLRHIRSPLSHHSMNAAVQNCDHDKRTNDVAPDLLHQQHFTGEHLNSTDQQRAPQQYIQQQYTQQQHTQEQLAHAEQEYAERLLLPSQYRQQQYAEQQYAQQQLAPQQYAPQQYPQQKYAQQHCLQNPRLLDCTEQPRHAVTSQTATALQPLTASSDGDTSQRMATAVQQHVSADYYKSANCKCRVESTYNSRSAVNNAPVHVMYPLHLHGHEGVKDHFVEQQDHIRDCLAPTAIHAPERPLALHPTAPSSQYKVNSSNTTAAPVTANHAGFGRSMCSAVAASAYFRQHPSSTSYTTSCHDIPRSDVPPQPPPCTLR